MAKRRVLPDTRDSITHKVYIESDQGRVSLFVTVGMYANGDPGELWMSVGKQGSTLRGMTDTAAIAISLMLQHRVPLKTIVDQFKNHSYLPNGPTSNPEIPHCASIIDYVVRWLEFKFLKEEVNGK